MSIYFPPTSFYFKVEFTDIGSSSKDLRFQEVSGLSVDVETEDFKEGGENRFVHKLPVRTKYSDLTLKRGLLTDSKVIKWCRKAIEDFEFNPIDINITLLNEEGEPINMWAVHHAYPVHWSISDFNSMDSKISVETIKLHYNYFKVINGASAPLTAFGDKLKQVKKLKRKVDEGYSIYSKVKRFAKRF
ncbi:phage tail protein [Ekhidna sp.]